MDKDTRNKIIQLGLDKRDGKIDLSWDQIGKQFGLSGERARDLTRKYAYRNGLSQAPIISNPYLKNIEPEEQYRSTLEINKDGSQTSEKLLAMSEEQSKDVAYLLQAHGYCPKSWDIVSSRSSMWHVGEKTRYSSRIVVKPLQEYKWNTEDVSSIFDNLGSPSNAPRYSPCTTPTGEDLLVVAIADLHYNLLSDLYSTGNKYDTEIAKQVYFTTLNDILQRVKGKSFKKILFVVGNDFVNADNIAGTTTKGTPQDNQSPWFSLINDVTQMIVSGIDMFVDIAPVDVVYVPSNHDLHTMFGVMNMVKIWYRLDDRVTVDESPLERKYYTFGKTLVGLSHDLKVKDALRIMTTEAKDKWSGCNNMIWMLAHLHQSMVYEKQGHMEVYRLPTVSGWSRWSNGMGYVQTEKKNQSFIISGELGITDTLNTVISCG